MVVVVAVAIVVVVVAAVVFLVVWFIVILLVAVFVAIIVVAAVVQDIQIIMIHLLVTNCYEHNRLSAAWFVACMLHYFLQSVLGEQLDCWLHTPKVNEIKHEPFLCILAVWTEISRLAGRRTDMASLT